MATLSGKRETPSGNEPSVILSLPGTPCSRFVFQAPARGFDEWPFYAALRKTTNSVLVTVRRCAFSSK